MSRSKNIQIINKHSVFSKAEIEVGSSKDIALSAIDSDYLESIYAFRGWHGYSTLISSFYRDDNGSHGEGRASDQILFEKYLEDPINPDLLMRLATHWPFTGVGIYFDWAFTNRKTGKKQRAAGAHLDTSKKNTRPLRWFAVSFDKDGNHVTPLLLPKERREGITRTFFYKDVTDGLFKAPGVSNGITFESAIQKYWNND